MKCLITKGEYLLYKKSLIPKERFYNKVKGSLYLRYKGCSMVPESAGVECDIDLRGKEWNIEAPHKPFETIYI